MGIGVLLAGIAVAALGFSSHRARNRYLQAIQGLRRGGAQWLMAEMESKRSARRTFDKLRRMAS